MTIAGWFLYTLGCAFVGSIFPMLMDPFTKAKQEDVNTVIIISALWGVVLGNLILTLVTL